jgi:hypothetical protein
MAQRWNSSRAPERPRRRMRSKQMISLQVRKGISTLLRWSRDCLQEGRINVNIHVSLGAIRGTPAQWISPSISPNLIFGTHNRRRQ